MKIDWWTLGMQTVNIAVLVWLLQHFFWRPVAAMIEQRRVAAAGVLTDAETQRAASVAALAEIATTRAGFAHEREAILAAAATAAAAAAKARLDAADATVATRDAASRAAIEAERQAAASAWSDRSGQLAIAIAERLAARLDGPAIRSRFLDWLVDEIGRLPAPSREAASTEDLDAVTATALDDADQQRCRSRIAEAFGAHPQIAFSVDPALIAGIELHAPHLLVANSWRADLSQILADLNA